MKKYDIFYSDEAINDLRTVFHYYMSKSSNADFSNIIINHIYKACDELSFFPNKHPLVSWPIWSARGIRKKLINNYLIFYYVDELRQQVVINRILSTRQHVTSMVCEQVSHYNK
jgi:toxin ParE1/3/4